MSSRPQRARVNISVVQDAQRQIKADLDAVDGRCNKQMTIEEPAAAEEAKEEKSKSDSDYMSCSAKVYKSGDTLASEGSYSSESSTHAEMNALVAYAASNADFTGITKIEISSPPCKSCAFVLELLGVIDKVHTTKRIYKNFTGAWHWPGDLQVATKFDATRWSQIKGYFVNSGVDEAFVISAMVKRIQSKSDI